METYKVYDGTIKKGGKLYSVGDTVLLSDAEYMQRRDFVCTVDEYKMIADNVDMTDFDGKVLITELKNRLALKESELKKAIVMISNYEKEIGVLKSKLEGEQLVTKTQAEQLVSIEAITDWARDPITVTAQAALAANIMVDQSGAVCGRGEKACGVTEYGRDSGELATIYTSGFCKVEAAGTIAVGDKISSDADGKGLVAIDAVQNSLVTADAAITSSTTLVDSGLECTLGPAQMAVFKTKVIVANADGAAARTVKFQVDGPVGLTAVGLITGADEAGNVTVIDTDADFTSDVTYEVALSKTAVLEFTIVLDTAAAGGDCKLQWAPNASVAAAMTLKANSSSTMELNSTNEVSGVAHTAASSGSLFVMDMA